LVGSRHHPLLLPLGCSTWNPPVDLRERDVRVTTSFGTKRGELYRLSDLTVRVRVRLARLAERPIEPPRGRHWGYDQVGMDRLWAEGRIESLREGKAEIKNLLRTCQAWRGSQTFGSHRALIQLLPNAGLVTPLRSLKPFSERIIRASSSEGELVSDPFCGCGTASRSHRSQPPLDGIDITHLAIV